jgi:hypothetical protein
MSCAQFPRALNGWFRGCVAAAAVLHVITLLGTVGSITGGQLTSIALMFVFVLPLTLLFVCVFTGIPAGAVIWLAERLKIRSLFFYVFAGLAIGASFCALLFELFGSFGAAFVLAGCAAGAVYWFVAGKYAGED